MKLTFKKYKLGRRELVLGLLFVLFFGVADVTTTIMCAERYGTFEYEQNGLAQWMYGQAGYAGLVVMKAFAVCFIFAVVLLTRFVLVTTADSLVLGTTVAGAMVSVSNLMFAYTGHAIPYVGLGLILVIGAFTAAGGLADMYQLEHLAS